jgi:hypothetical protein
VISDFQPKIFATGGMMSEARNIESLLIAMITLSVISTALAIWIIFSI